MSIGHVSPEAANKGNIALVEDGDKIVIDIPNRRIDFEISEQELSRRKEAMEANPAAAYKPKSRDRVVSKALKAYSMSVSSADKGAVRIID